MSKYLVRVTETFQKFIYVEADDIEDARACSHKKSIKNHSQHDNR